MWIQALLVTGLIIVGGFFMRRTGADSHLAIRRLLFLAFIGLAVATVLFPQLLTRIANLVGVGRGADLLLYVFVLAFLFFVYGQYRQGVTQQRKITHLARKIALLEAVERKNHR